MALGISLLGDAVAVLSTMTGRLCRTASPQMPVLSNSYRVWRDDDDKSAMNFPGPGIEDEFRAILVVMVDVSNPASGQFNGLVQRIIEKVLVAFRRVLQDVHKLFQTCFVTPYFRCTLQDLFLKQLIPWFFNWSCR